MGGLIALAVALGAPARALTLSLLCMFADGAGPTRPSVRMIALGLPTRIGTRRMRRLAMQRMLFPDDYLHQVDRAALAEQLNLLFGRDLGEAPPIVWEQLKVMGRYDVTPRLPSLAGVPTLVAAAGTIRSLRRRSAGRSPPGSPGRATSRTRTPAMPSRSSTRIGSTRCCSRTSTPAARWIRHSSATNRGDAPSPPRPSGRADRATPLRRPTPDRRPAGRRRNLVDKSGSTSSSGPG